MPVRALRPCVTCGKASSGGRCAAHPKVDTRGTRQQRGYDAEYYALVPQVLERDGWVCQLCLLPIYKEKPRTRWAPSADHITPLSKGGQNALYNLRAAHYGCNSARGNRLTPEVAKLAR